MMGSPCPGTATLQPHPMHHFAVHLHIRTLHVNIACLVCNSLIIPACLLQNCKKTCPHSLLGLLTTWLADSLVSACILYLSMPTFKVFNVHLFRRCATPMQSNHCFCLIHKPVVQYVQHKAGITAAATTGSAITAQPETTHILNKLDERAGPVFGIMRGHQHV